MNPKSEHRMGWNQSGSSAIDLCQSLFDWAPFDPINAAIKGAATNASSCDQCRRAWSATATESPVERLVHQVRLGRLAAPACAQAVCVRFAGRRFGQHGICAGFLCAGVSSGAVGVCRTRARWHRRYVLRAGSGRDCQPVGGRGVTVKAPRECIDYVVLHELIHLQHHHHGPAFYRALDRHMPGWRAGGEGQAGRLGRGHFSRLMTQTVGASGAATACLWPR